MPDFSRFRRLPVVLPPMDRQFLSSFSLKKSSSHPKIHRRKSPIKVQQAAAQQHEENEQTRYKEQKKNFVRLEHQSGISRKKQN